MLLLRLLFTSLSWRQTHMIFGKARSKTQGQVRENDRGDAYRCVPGLQRFRRCKWRERWGDGAARWRSKWAAGG